MPSTDSLIHHPNGQTSHIVEDNFSDPWKPCETILIQHGFARHAAFWYHWVPVLSRQYRVIRRDLRGHGLSSTGDDPKYDYSVQTICDEIIDTLDQLKIDRVHFLGESTSGMLGEILAARHPERLHSLIICSSPTWLPPAALNLFAFGQKDWPTALRQVGSRGWGEALARVPGTLSITDPEYTSWWKDQVAVSSAEGLAKYAIFLSTLDSRPYLKDIKIPVLILAPVNSAATKLEEQRGIKEAIPNAEMVVINGKGHEIYVEMAAECQDAVLKFLHGLRASSS
ncbi:Alpha/Beta hydrolase protein [Exophiala viscosa]|uniref:Alpha/Beta hydrolase protein n=1 Tax=Exophiala viscosa TaxID=2486360 RepID=A0AAN6IB13_9EURO|nr:Alpha/Beta hydrolase protein [Exophiala viscosa]